MNLVQIFRALAPGAAGSQLLRKLPPLALQLLLDYCVEPRVLMADSTADVGIADLLRTLECVVATEPILEAAQFQQLVGRVSRLAVDIEDRGSVAVICQSNAKTLDESLHRHLSYQVS